MVHPPEEGHECVGDGCLRTVEQARDVARGFLLVAAPDGGSAVDAVLLVVSGGTLASREGSAGSWCRTCRTMCRSTSMRRERR